MKKIFIVVFSLIMFFTLGIKCYADETDHYKEDLYNSMPGIAQDVFDNGFTDAEVAEKTGMDYILGMLLNSFTSTSRENSSVFRKIITICIISCLACMLAKDSKPSKNVSMCVSLASSVSLYTILYPSISVVKTYLSDISSFASALVPVNAGILMSGGNVSTAATSALSMGIFIALTDRLCIKLLLPLCLCVLGFSVCDCFSPGFNANAISSFVKKCFLTLIGFVCMLITASLGMQTALSSAKDSLTAKSMKFAVSSSLPIVGSTVSSSLSILSASLSVLKTTVGLGSVIAVLAISFPAIAYVFSIRFVLSMCGSVAELVGVKESEKVYKSFTSVFDMLLAMLVLSSVTLVIVLAMFVNTSFAIG